MTIKVKHILLVLLVVIVAIILYNVFKKPLNEMIIKSIYEKQIVDNYNNFSFTNVAEGVIAEYEYYKNYYNEPDIDISPLIESYIKQIETNERNPYNVGGLEVHSTSNGIRAIEGYDYTDDIYVIYGKDRIASISELEKILIHKSDNKYSDWWIPKDSHGIIDLPYNYYLKYEPSDFKLLDKVKKVTKCTFIDPVTYGYARKDIKLDYIDVNEIKQSLSSVVYISERTNRKIGMFFQGVYYTESHTAKIELCNHISDMIIDEIEGLGYSDNPAWDIDWEREDCKEIVNTVKDKLAIKN